MKKFIIKGMGAPFDGKVVTLEEISEEDELDGTNPYGNIISENRCLRDGYDISWINHVNCLVVTVRHGNQTLLSKMYEGKKAAAAMGELEEFMHGSNFDSDDMIFILQSI